MAPSIVCIGEAMVEFSRGDDGLWRQGFAGDTLNVAWAMRALLPAEAEVSFLTRLGADPFSDRLRDFLDESGIGTDMLSHSPDRAIGLYTIETDAAGEREFSYWRGQSAARELAADRNLLRAALDGADLVYFSGITLAILPPDDRAGFLALLRDCGAQIAFDPNYRPRLWDSKAAAQSAFEEAAGLSDIVMPTFDDEALAFDDASPNATMSRYQALGVTELVIKNGTEPTHFLAARARGCVPLTQAVKAVDTTGAGDSFNGSYLAARLAGHGIEAAIRRGQDISRLVVGHRGALVAMDQLAHQFERT